MYVHVLFTICTFLKASLFAISIVLFLRMVYFSILAVSWAGTWPPVLMALTTCSHTCVYMCMHKQHSKSSIFIKFKGFYCSVLLINTLFCSVATTLHVHTRCSLITSRNVHSARMAGPKIALRFPHLFVCLSVCASALITCTIYYVIHYYATAVYSSFWRFAAQATANEGSCVSPRWRKLGRQP